MPKKIFNISCPFRLQSRIVLFAMSTSPHSTQLELFLIHLLIIAHSNRVVFSSVLFHSVQDTQCQHTRQKNKSKVTFFLQIQSIVKQASVFLLGWSLVSVYIQQLRWRIAAYSQNLAIHKQSLQTFFYKYLAKINHFCLW